MKKVMMLAVMVAGMISNATAQDAANLPEQSDKGQAVRTAAQGPETGKEKGQLVSATASENGVERSTEAKAKGDQEQETDGSAANATPNHGTDVKAVASDESLTGKDKGAAVKAVATSNPKAQRPERQVRERVERPERAQRVERARRPTTTRRPTVPGRQ
jgi:hypothetical protein